MHNAGHWDSVGKQDNLCVYISKTMFQKVWKEYCSAPLCHEPEERFNIAKGSEKLKPYFVTFDFAMFLFT
jgi:hypothetical protein